MLFLTIKMIKEDASQDACALVSLLGNFKF